MAAVAPGREELPPPNEIGGGKKVYSIQGMKFEVDIRYDVMKAVGYGAYGLVCSACDTLTGDRVAIKKIPKVFEDLVDGKRILREIKLLRFLKHENVLNLRQLLRPRDPDRFEDVYFVSDFLETDLYQLIRSKQRLTEDHYQYFMYQAFRGLAYIHSANVLHRDLKPGNLLANANCELVICDFGLARGYDPKSLTDYVVTRWYRPPELLMLSAQYTSSIDVWSLGCILAELIMRKPLFPGRDYVHQLNLITDALGVPTDEDLSTVQSEDALKYVKSMPHKRKAPMASVVPTASPAALDFLSKLLVLDPSKRLTAKEAMHHEYLAHLSDETDEPESPNVFHWDFDNEDLTEKQLRQGFWDEILKYQVH